MSFLLRGNESNSDSSNTFGCFVVFNILSLTWSLIDLLPIAYQAQHLWGHFAAFHYAINVNNYVVSCSTY